MGESTNYLASFVTSCGAGSKALKLLLYPLLLAAGFISCYGLNPRTETLRATSAYYSDPESIINKAKLSLSCEQLAQFRRIYLEITEQRVNHELSIASVSETGPGECIISIPAYPEAGKLLRDQFATALGQYLGPDLAASLAKSNPILLAYQSYWGAYPQQIKVTKNKALSGFDLKHIVNPHRIAEHFRKESHSQFADA